MSFERPFSFKIVDSIPAALATDHTPSTSDEGNTRLSSTILDARFTKSLKQHTAKYAPGSSPGKPLRVLVCLLLKSTQMQHVSSLELLYLQQLVYDADAINLSYSITTSPNVVALKSRIPSTPMPPINSLEHLPEIHPMRIDNIDPPDIKALIQLLAHAPGTAASSESTLVQLMDSHTSLRSIATSLAATSGLSSRQTPISASSITNRARFTAGGARFPQAPPPPLSRHVQTQTNVNGSPNVGMPVLPATNPYRSQRGTAASATRAGHPFLGAGAGQSGGGGGYRTSAGRKMGGGGYRGSGSRSRGSGGNGGNGSGRKAWGGSGGGRGGRGGWRGRSK